MPNHRTVLLGSTGFLGKPLLERLRTTSGGEVLGLGSKDLDLCAADAPDKLRNLLRDGDQVAFVSALTPDRGRDSATMIKNLQMVQNFCAGISDTKLGYVLYLSSDAVYSDQWSYRNEETPCHPSSYHGFMHLGREMMLKEALGKSSTPFCFLRPVAVYGAGDTHNSYGPNRFLKQARSENVISMFGEGEDSRDHVYVDDVIRVCELALQKQVPGCFNVTSGRSISFKKVAETLVELLPQTVSIAKKPQSAATSHIHYDPCLLRTTFPDFTPTSWRDGAAQTIARVEEL